jgi:homocitrate synthase NifV
MELQAQCQKAVWIVDTTLRDGEQAPGVVFSRKEKQKIATLLCQVGVQEIEVGTPAMGEEEQEDIRSVVALKLPARFVSWCRANVEDIEQAKKCRTQGIHLSFPVSSVLMSVFHMDEHKVLAILPELVNYARKYFDYVSVGIQDATRADFAFLSAFCLHAFESGADRIRLSDTVGIYNPMQTIRLITQLRERGVSGMLEFHGHNDLGMATANSIAALSAGAEYISATVNGIGERAGNAALEEVVMATILTLRKECGINTEGLTRLSKMVAQASRRRIPETKPIVGKAAFLHESGIHTRALLANRQSYQPFFPEMVGMKSEGFVVGKHSGRASLKYLFNQEGIRLSEADCLRILVRIREICRKKKSLSLEEIRQIYREMVAEPTSIRPRESPKEMSPTINDGCFKS